MRRLWPLLILLVAVCAALVIVLGSGEGDPYGGELERGEGEKYVPPELRGAPGADPSRRPRERPRTPPPTTPEPGPTGPEVGPDGLVLALEGRCVDAESGEPVGGAGVTFLRHAEPCPRLLAAPTVSFAAAEEVYEGPPTAATSGKDGRFAVRVRPQDVPATGGADLLARAKGYVPQMVCQPGIPSEVEVRMEKGLELQGTVKNSRGTPVEGAYVRARPAEETPALLGHGSLAAVRTGEKGAFTLDGFRPGAVLVDVDHPHYMPVTSDPVNPADEPALELVLQAAFRVTFQIRTDDGRAPEHPTLVWRTTEATPRSGVILLPCPSSWESDDDQGNVVDGESTCGPVRLPVDAPGVVLQIRADGYATWRSEPMRFPAEGGEKTFEVKLSGDLSTGTLKASFEDQQGAKIHYGQARAQAAIARLDPGAAPSAYVLEQGEDLKITALPAGTYRLRLQSARFAPVQTDFTITAGQETVLALRVGPPAQVRVRFFAPDATMVRFRLMQEGRIALGIPVGAAERGVDEETGEPILAAGNDGLLLSGLAAGTYTIEVISEELIAPATIVHLKEGDTQEVEIQVTRR